MQGRARLTPVAAGGRATTATVRVLVLPGLVEGAPEGLEVRRGDDLLPVEVSVGRHLFLTRSSSRRLLTVGHALGILLLALPRSLARSFARPSVRPLARPSLPFPGPHSARTRKIEQKYSKCGGVTELVWLAGWLAGWLAELRTARRGGECVRFGRSLGPPPPPPPPLTLSFFSAVRSFVRRRRLALSCSALLPRVRVPLLPHSRAVVGWLAGWLAVLRRRRMRWSSSWSQRGLTG